VAEQAAQSPAHAVRLLGGWVRTDAADAA
jgi:hypothetical protein